MPEHDHTRPGAGEPGVEPGLTAGGTSGLADVLTVVGGLVRDAEVPPSVEECEALLTGLNTVSYVVEGLADKIRASGAVRGPTAAQVSVRMARLTCVVATVPWRPSRSTTSTRRTSSRRGCESSSTPR